jgi:hypothetical protein
LLPLHLETSLRSIYREISQSAWLPFRGEGQRLHREIGDANALLAIATWDSKASRDAMEANADSRIREIIATQAEFIDVRVIGEFEAPEWVVEPLP